jgi:hypothetical protein
MRIKIEKAPEMKKGGWLKGAVHPSHKGFCSPESKRHVHAS